MENVTSLQEQFKSNFPQLAGADEPQLSTFIKSMKVASNAFDITLAACSIDKQSYLFSHISTGEIDIIDQQSYSFSAFQQLVHPEDQPHYEEAMEMAYRFIQEKKVDEFANIGLCFECRFKDGQGSYQRLLVSYHVMNCQQNFKPEILTLNLFHIGNHDIDNPSRAIYIIDRSTKECLLHNSKGCLTESEINISRLFLKGYLKKEIAEILSVSRNVVYKRFSSMTHKTRSKNILFLFNYLSRLGVV